MATAITAPTVDAGRQRTINALVEPIRRVMQAQGVVSAAWLAFKAEQNRETAARLNRAMADMEIAVNDYLDGVEREMVVEADAVSLLTTRNAALERALRELIAECTNGDNRGERPALSRAVDVRDRRAR